MRWPFGLFALGVLCLVALYLSRCRHRFLIREHRPDGWHLVCPRCGYSLLLNPRDKEPPKAVGTYDERKAIAGKARSERIQRLRRHAAARPLPEPNEVEVRSIRERFGRS